MNHDCVGTVSHDSHKRTHVCHYLWCSVCIVPSSWVHGAQGIALIWKCHAFLNTSYNNLFKIYIMSTSLLFRLNVVRMHFITTPKNGVSFFLMLLWKKWKIRIKLSRTFDPPLVNKIFIYSFSQLSIYEWVSRIVATHHVK